MIGRHDAAWRGTKEWLEGEIAKLHVQLERSDLLEKEHNVTRGQIAAYRALIRTVEPVAIPEPQTTNYTGY